MLPCYTIRHTVPLSCAADFLRHYVKQRGVSSRHRREGVSAHPAYLISVVRSSTSGPLVASDTDSSTAPSSQPMSLQFVAVGIRRPRRQSYVVFQYVKELFSFRPVWRVADSDRPAHPGLFRGITAMRNGGPHSPYSNIAGLLQLFRLSPPLWFYVGRIRLYLPQTSLPDEPVYLVFWICP